MARRLLLLVVVSAFAAFGGLSVGAYAGEAKAEEKLDPNEKICKIQRETGTFMRRRVCLTRAEWDELDAKEQRKKKKRR